MARERLTGSISLKFNKDREPVHNRGFRKSHPFLQNLCLPDHSELNCRKKLASFCFYFIEKNENHGKQKRKQRRKKKKEDHFTAGIGTFRKTRTSDECKLWSPAHFSFFMESGLRRNETSPEDPQHKERYVCSQCGTTLFDAAAKFEAGCGFPSFWQHSGNNVKQNLLLTYGRRRIQLLCAACGQHLGHLFESKVTPSSVRYCINSRSIVTKK